MATAAIGYLLCCMTFTSHPCVRQHTSFCISFVFCTKTFFFFGTNIPIENERKWKWKVDKNNKSGHVVGAACSFKNSFVFPAYRAVFFYRISVVGIRFSSRSIAFRSACEMQSFLILCFLPEPKNKFGLFLVWHHPFETDSGENTKKEFH